MAKPEKTKSGFVIKLSNETVQKLNEEEKNLQSEGEDSKNKQDSTGLLNDIIEKASVSDTNDITKVETQQEECAPLTENSEKGKGDSENKVETNELWGDYSPYISYEGVEAIYTDPNNKQKYTWNKESNSWVPKGEPEGRTYSYENDTHIYTESDGSKFFWDDEKKAWIPKVDDDFLALYQMSYGFVDNTSVKNEDQVKLKEERKKLDAGVKRKSEPTWFEQSDEKNTKVYVSNLPTDLTEEDFVNLMQKCGLVERDPVNQKMKVKLYMDKEQNCFKGDALCTYIKIESVDLALKLLDGSDYKGNKIKVERAQFQMKGDYNPALKPKKKKKKELEKLKKMQQKLFDWRPEKFIGERSKHERIVIVKNLFHPSDFDNDVQLILDYQQDLREECSKCGEVRKVVIYDAHPEGVAQITMKEPEQADAVIQLINGRWFGKRQITAETYDGRTKYRIAETDADINKRINKWDKFLEEEEAKKDKNTTNESKSNTSESEKVSSEKEESVEK
ncbi:putative DEAD box ATP-dependent RNA helicase [Danaus plexippus plexippus]|uniref:17S U2 SnRNP complex component HTATSF1 n=1 Tax=Danaus plexippus plexippus TaxID=278856 RepID=A0A212FC14_DANPL|nr:putative DEAD box ATP-dependent RNA helicase [Danaus plexippus plexippus]